MKNSFSRTGADLSARINYQHVGWFLDECIVKYTVHGQKLRVKDIARELHMSNSTLNDVKKG